MAEFKYRDIKDALNLWGEDKKRFKNTDEQHVRGFHVGHYTPSNANWSYHMYAEILDTVEGEEVVALTIRRFGSLVGVINSQLYKYMV